MEGGQVAEAESEALERWRPTGHWSVRSRRRWRGRHRIGRCRLARHDAGGAKEATERALMIRRKVLPGNHPDLGRSLNNLGLAESGLGNKRRTGIPRGSRAVMAVFAGVLKPAHGRGVEQPGKRCCASCGSMRRPSRPITGVAIRRKSLPPDHPDIASSLNNLGKVQDALREYAAAKQSYEQALAIREVPASGPPRYRLQFVRPGDGAVRVAGVCGGQAEP